MSESSYSDWSKSISSYMPKPDISVNKAQLFANFMVIIAVLGVFPLAFQAYKVYSTKKTDGISLPAFVFQIFISLTWIVYAIISGNGIIMISSGLLVIAAVALVFFTWKHKGTPDDETMEDDHTS